MSKQGFIPVDDQEYYNWYENFKTKLSKNAETLNMTQVLEGTVPANSSINIVQADFSDEMLIKLENTGSSMLRFCIGLSATGNCNAPRGVVVNPAETITATVEELGNGERKFLNVTASSPGATTPGDYRVTMPDTEHIIALVSQGNPVQKSITNTTQKRDEWKEAAATKNAMKSTFVSGLLRPFIQNKIKTHDNYTEAMGKDMGIVEETPYIDPATMKPVIIARLNAGAVDIIWKKGAADAIRIEVDRNDTKGFVLVGIDTQPDYRDTTPLPVVPTVWKYRAIYIIKDEIVGQWSDTVQITVVK